MIFFLRTERWTEVARKKNICGKPNHYSISQNWVRATQLWGTHGDTQIYTQYHVWVSFVRAPASSGRSRITAVTVAPFKPNTQGGGGRESLPNHAFLVRVHQHTLEFPREHNWLTWGGGVYLFLIRCCELWIVMAFSFYGVSWSHRGGKHTPA